MFFSFQVTLLSALQYLPDIVQLQTSLYEICHHRIDQKDAEMSIEEFIRGNIAKGRILMIRMLCIGVNYFIFYYTH